MFKPILLPTDRSLLSVRAIHAAVQFAKEPGTSLAGLPVAEPYPFSPLSGSTFPSRRQ